MEKKKPISNMNSLQNIYVFIWLDLEINNFSYDSLLCSFDINSNFSLFKKEFLMTNKGQKGKKTCKIQGFYFKNSLKYQVR